MLRIARALFSDLSLCNVLLQLNQSSAGSAILAAVHPGITAFVPAADTDYDGLRALVEEVAVSAR